MRKIVLFPVFYYYYDYTAFILIWFLFILTTPILTLPFTTTRTTNSLFMSSLIQPNGCLHQVKWIHLPNDLEALLIHDPNPNHLPFISLDINVGSFSDPIEFPGLAHFLEHIISLGSKQCPQPPFSKHGSFHSSAENRNHKQKGRSSFQFFKPLYQFVSTTKETHTQFFLETSSLKLFKAWLPCFADMFHHPLLLLSQLYKEKPWFISELMHLIQPSASLHPIPLATVFIDSLLHFASSNFSSSFTSSWLLSSSSWKSIKLGHFDALLQNYKFRKALLSFFQTYYSSNLIKLVVQSSANLNEMESWITKAFQFIPNHDWNVPYNDATLTSPWNDLEFFLPLFHPSSSSSFYSPLFLPFLHVFFFKPNPTPSLVLNSSSNSSSSPSSSFLLIVWKPGYQELQASHFLPFQFFKYLTLHTEANGLLSFLKHQTNLITSLEVTEDPHLFQLIKFNFTLTQHGWNHLDLIFYYVNQWFHFLNMFSLTNETTHFTNTSSFHHKTTKQHPELGVLPKLYNQFRILQRIRFTFNYSSSLFSPSPSSSSSSSSSSPSSSFFASSSSTTATTPEKSSHCISCIFQFTQLFHSISNSSSSSSSSLLPFSHWLLYFHQVPTLSVWSHSLWTSWFQPFPTYNSSVLAPFQYILISPPLSSSNSNSTSESQHDSSSYYYEPYYQTQYAIKSMPSHWKPHHYLLQPFDSSSSSSSSFSSNQKKEEFQFPSFMEGLPTNQDFLELSPFDSFTYLNNSLRIDAIYQPQLKFPLVWMKLRFENRLPTRSLLDAVCLRLLFQAILHLPQWTAYSSSSSFSLPLFQSQLSADLPQDHVLEIYFYGYLSQWYTFIEREFMEVIQLQVFSLFITRFHLLQHQAQERLLRSYSHSFTSSSSSSSSLSIELSLHVLNELWTEIKEEKDFDPIHSTTSEWSFSDHLVALNQVTLNQLVSFVWNLPQTMALHTLILSPGALPSSSSSTFPSSFALLFPNGLPSLFLSFSQAASIWPQCWTRSLLPLGQTKYPTSSISSSAGEVPLKSHSNFFSPPPSFPPHQQQEQQVITLYIQCPNDDQDLKWMKPHAMYTDLLKHMKSNRPTVLLVFSSTLFLDFLVPLLETELRRLPTSFWITSSSSSSSSSSSFVRQPLLQSIHCEVYRSHRYAVYDGFYITFMGSFLNEAYIEHQLHRFLQTYFYSSILLPSIHQPLVQVQWQHYLSSRLFTPNTPTSSSSSSFSSSSSSSSSTTTTSWWWWWTGYKALEKKEAHHSGPRLWQVIQSSPWVSVPKHPSFLFATNKEVDSSLSSLSSLPSWLFHHGLSALLHFYDYFILPSSPSRRHLLLSISPTPLVLNSLSPFLDISKDHPILFPWIPPQIHTWKSRHIQRIKRCRSNN